MSKFISLTIFIFLSLSFFAHRGEFASIENVNIVETEDSYIYKFQFENIKQTNLSNITIELVINGEPLQLIEIKEIKSKFKFVAGEFTILKKGFDITNDVVQIEVTKLFGKRNDWGGWDSPTYETKQSNTLASEFFADAPWRMKKTDENGLERDIPIHFYLHDAHKVQLITLQIDYINVRIKNASSSSFGPVLTYNNISDASFKSMFSSKSPNDPQLDIQEFKLSSFSASSSYTMDFDEDNDIFGDDFVEADQTYWYFTFNIPASELQGMEDIIDVEVKIGYSNTTISSDYIGLRIFRQNENLPSMPNWYRGDTHLHSLFTQNSAETGLPIEATIEAGKLIGLDWFTTTDHTSDYDNYGGGNIHTNWTKLQSMVQTLNTQNPNFKIIAGQEVATNNASGDLVHMLAYPSQNDPFSLQFLGDGDGDLSSTSIFIDDVINKLKVTDGFSYAAHPFSTADKLPTIPVGGGIWNFGNTLLPANGNNFPETGGNIICNDVNSTSDIFSSETGKLFKDRIVGAQLWNVRNGRETTSSVTGELDPWNVRGNDTPFSVFDTASFSHHIKKFRQGQEVVNLANRLGLVKKNANIDYKNWKLYISAGADAHGSFNFSNTDDFGSLGDLNTNAVGKLTTLTYCPDGMGDNGEGILKALYKGNTTLSDGPIVTIGISDDGNNASNEILMGDDKVVNTLNIENYYLNIDYVTTVEFGNLNYLKLIAGTETGEITRMMPLTVTGGTNNINLLLTDILDSLFQNSTVPDSSYFYLRAEIQTTKDYTAVSSIYGSTYDNYHSFSNPIWISLYDVIPPAPEEPEEPITEFSLTVFPNPFEGDISLTIKNPTDKPVKINFYNDLGQIISSLTYPVQGEETIALPQNIIDLAKGVYTVKATVENYEAIETIVKIK